jgi:predicted dinucleotide-binding enzyme
MIAERIAVIGAGAWGTALANVIARAGRAVTLWARDPAVAAAILARRESPRLPGVRIDDRVALAALSGGRPDGDAILVVVPAQALRAAVSDLAGAVAPRTPVVACAKGIERGTGRFMTEIIAQCLPAAVPAILSGPSFASDVARGLPTAVTLAAPDEDTAGRQARGEGKGSSLSGAAGVVIAEDHDVRGRRGRLELLDTAVAERCPRRCPEQLSGSERCLNPFRDAHYGLSRRQPDCAPGGTLPAQNMRTSSTCPPSLSHLTGVR